jgi:hypothetical protein
MAQMVWVPDMTATFPRGVPSAAVTLTEIRSDCSLPSVILCSDSPMVAAVRFSGISARLAGSRPAGLWWTDGALSL